MKDSKENNSSYFSHDINARNSDKLIRLRMRWKAAGYGVYFMILERLREEPNYMSVKDYNMIAFDLREDASMIKSVVEDFGLFVFTDDGKYFYSESFNRRMAVKDEKARKQAEAGRKAMQRRWGKTADAKLKINNEKVNGAAEDKPDETDESNMSLQDTANSVTENEDSNESVSNLGENDNLLITNLGKNDNKKSKEKESKEKESKEINKEKNKETKKEKNTCDENGKTVEEKCRSTFDFFNQMTDYYKSSIKPVRVYTEERRRKIEAVVQRFTAEQIARAVGNAMTSDYLNGRTPRRKLPADFDWIFDMKNFVRIYEGSV